MMKKIFAGFLYAVAAAQVGTLTQIQGEVKLFAHPGKTMQGPAPHALFEGEYYSVRDAKAGDSVEKGNVLRTAVGSKARVVFQNGDQFNVGSGTAYRVSWDRDSAVANTSIKLMYGKMRGIIEKGGPRSKLTIRTKSASMGVRGTDFFVGEDGSGAGTRFSVLRGEVEVTPEGGKAIPVKAGQSADLPSVKKTAENKAKTPEHAKVELRQTTQEELTSIQKSSTVKPALQQDVAISENVSKKIQQLETKAVETTIQDIKVSDPKFYAQIQERALKNEFKTVEDINGQTVQNLVKDAPKMPARLKPGMKDFEKLEGDEYKKYFRLGD